MMNKILNHELIENLKATVERIPKDLKVWKSEIEKLKRKPRTPKTRAMIMEYYGNHRYYMGKFMAYLFVLEQLGEINYCIDWRVRKLGMVWHRKARGEVKFTNKNWRKNYLI